MNAYVQPRDEHPTGTILKSDVEELTSLTVALRAALQALILGVPNVFSASGTTATSSRSQAAGLRD